jgi:hypothetical protein
MVSTVKLSDVLELTVNKRSYLHRSARRIVQFLPSRFTATARQLVDDLQFCAVSELTDIFEFGRRITDL